MVHRSNGARVARLAVLALSLGACDVEGDDGPVAAIQAALELPDSGAINATRRPYTPFEKHKGADFRGRERDRIVVKFVEGSHVRLRGGRLDVDLAGVASDVHSDELARLGRVGLDRASARAALSDVRAILNGFPGVRVAKSFKMSDEELDAIKGEGEGKAGIELADLNLSYDIRVPEADAEALLDALNASELVEIAYAAPIYVSMAQDIAPSTSSFVTNQGYLNANGVDARFAWTRAGGTGAGVRVIDVEYGWNTGHEDLGAGGTNLPSASIRHNGCITDTKPNCPTGAPCHGTAVLGVIKAAKNSFGITGIAHAGEYGTSGIFETSACNDACLGCAIMQAGATPTTKEGDIILIEVGVYGPVACPNNGTDLCSPGTNPCQEHYGLLPVEWNANEFNAIQMVTAIGRIVIEPAANGEQNLDAAVYLNRFNRSVTDSGAIMVGGGNSVSRHPNCFTDFGSRLDVQGWGDSVRTLGYSDIQVNGNDQKQWYATGFGGTSAAGSVIAGTAAVLQSACKAGNIPGVCTAAGQILPAKSTGAGVVGMRELLASASTPQTTPVMARIGPLPNLRFALAPREPPAKGGVAAVKWTSTKNAVFAVDSSGGLVLRSKSGAGAWTAPAVMSGSANRFPPGAPVAVGMPDSTELRVFSVSNSGQLFFARSSSGGAFTTLTAIGGTNVVPPLANLATGIRNGNQLNVFFVDASNRLMTFTATGTSTVWTGPTQVATSFAPAGAPLATGRQGTNQLDVFGFASDGTLKAAWALDNGSWNAPVSLTAAGVALAWNPLDRSGGGVATGRQGSNQLDVFFIGNASGMYGIMQAVGVVGQGAWFGPVALHTTATYGPGSQLSTVQHGTNNDTLDVFARTTIDSTTALFSTRFMRVVGTGSFTGPTTVSAASGHGSDSIVTAAVNRSTNLADVVVIGTNGLSLATSTSGGSYTTLGTFP